MARIFPAVQTRPLTEDYLREVQRRAIAAPQGDWEVRADDAGELDGFGPFSFVEVFEPASLLPAIEFCRHARRDVPALLGEIARLLAELRAWENGERR